MSVDASELAREHYENFPVGSWLLPKRQRPHVHRLYAFARVADDLADEARDLNALRAWRLATEDALAGRKAPELLQDLAASVEEFSLDATLLFDLLDAFERDLVQDRYVDLEDLLSYCRQSADPVGRLMLQLFGKHNETNNTLSDRICTALQILNHLQDVASDYRERGRIYLPQDRLAAHAVVEADFAGPRTSPGLKSCIAELAEFCSTSFAAGWSLPRRVGGRFGLELRGILTSACLVLDRLQRVDYEVFARRPSIGKTDAPEILLRSLLPWPPRAARQTAAGDAPDHG